MQNSPVLSRSSVDGALSKEPHKSEANSAQSTKPPVKRVLSKIKKTAGILASKNINNKHSNSSNSIGGKPMPATTTPATATPLATTTPATPLATTMPATPLATASPTPTLTPFNCLDFVGSSTSIASRRTDADSEETSQRLRNKFTRPRLNQLTEQRIQRLRNSLTEAGNVGQLNMPSPLPRTKKKEAVSPAGQRSSQDETKPCPQTMAAMQNQLEEMQSEFMQKVASFREQGYGYAYKLVTVVRNDNCQVLVHNDDLLGLPKYLPERSVKDFKDMCHDVFKAGFTFMFEQIASVQMAEDQTIADARREDLRLRLESEMNDKMGVVDKELMQLCSDAAKEESSCLMRQACELSEANNQLKTLNVTLDKDIADVRKNREELKRLLEVSQERNLNLGLELAGKNISLVEQGGAIDDLRAEIKRFKKTNKSMCQRLKDYDVNLELSREVFNQHAEHINDLDDQLLQAQANRLFLKHKTEELNLIIADKDRLIAEQKHQLADLEKSKAWQAAQTGATGLCEADKALISEQKAELARVRAQLLAQEQVEQMLRDEADEKQEALRKAELKLSRLEEQIEHHRQVLAVRGERINSLDQEMKQREQESNRKINDIMAQTSDKNTLITQITNELASTNEQFQNLCSTLSMKQTKLHSQEHVIKLLEESNARSVKLHAKLGEKNALLKDELDHLRRTVNNLMLGSDASEMEVADILLE